MVNYFCFQLLSFEPAEDYFFGKIEFNKTSFCVNCDAFLCCNFYCQSFWMKMFLYSLQNVQ